MAVEDRDGEMNKIQILVGISRNLSVILKVWGTIKVWGFGGGG